VIRLGTRGSTLALAQARSVAAALGSDVEIVPMRTEGDRLADARNLRRLAGPVRRDEIDRAAAERVREQQLRLAAGVVRGAAQPRDAFLDERSDLGRH